MLPWSTWRMPVRPAIGATMLGVVEDRLGVVDLRLIEFHLGFLLRHRHLLRVELLPRDRVAGHELGVAFEIEPRVGERRLVQRLLRHRLIVGGLIGGGIDLRQHVAALDVLAFGVVDAEQLAVDLRPHRHGVQRPDGADAVEIDRHVGPLGQGRDDRDRPVIAAAAAAKARLLLLLRRLPPNGSGDPDQNEGNEGSRDRSSCGSPSPASLSRSAPINSGAAGRFTAHYVHFMGLWRHLNADSGLWRPFRRLVAGPSSLGFCQPPPSAWNSETTAVRRSNWACARTSWAWNSVCWVCSRVTRSMVPSRSRVSDMSNAVCELVTTSRCSRSRSAVCCTAISARSTSAKPLTMALR